MDEISNLRLLTGEKLIKKLNYLQKYQRDIIQDINYIPLVVDLILSTDLPAIGRLIDNPDFWVNQIDLHRNSKLLALYQYIATLQTSKATNDELVSYQFRVVEEMIINNLLLILGIVLDDSEKDY